MNIFADARRWFNLRALLVGAILGMFGTITLWADMRIPQIPALNIGADVREIFVILGAAFGGPFGGLLAGAFSALYSPVGDFRLHLATWLSNTLAGFSLGLAYRPLREEIKGIAFIGVWTRSLIVYYLTLLSCVTVFIGIFSPKFFLPLAGPSGGIFMSYLNFWLAALPEIAFVIPITLVLMLALPHGYRKPLWDVDKPNKP